MCFDRLSNHDWLTLSCTTYHPQSIASAATTSAFNVLIKVTNFDA